VELAIDTSSNIAGIALSHQGEILIELTWRTAQNHTVELTPNIARLLQQANIEANAIEAIIVAKGPGSFNGLRVGISTAKGLAFSLDIPLLGVSTLEIEAYPFAYTGLPLRPIHKAGREEIATALYQQINNEWCCLEKEYLTTLDALYQETHQEALFCGEISPDIANAIQQNLGKRAIIPQTTRFPRVGFLAMLGWRRLNKGEKDDLATLQPLYLRPPHITKPKKAIYQSPCSASERQGGSLNKAKERRIGDANSKIRPR
jgi:tRNA threonylcarbamoyl adenosine modification protein YeaZ